MLEVSQLTRRYGDFTAVSDVSFSIAGSEIVGLLGHNGAGKTTIMKMLSGFLEPDDGCITLNGLDISQNLRRAQAEIGYLPESLPVYPELTVADYLDYAATLKGLHGPAKMREIGAAVAATEIGDRAHALIGTLSRGYKQRVGVAQALLGKPALLILDEPTNGLDPTQTAHMRTLIRECAQHATVILSTHIMQEVDALCGRALILQDGKLAVDASLAELRTGNELTLECSLPLAALQKHLSDVPGFSGLLPLNDGGRPEQFRVTLDIDTPDALRSAAAGIARSVADAGGDLFALRPAGRDLESLFRSVTSATTAGAPQHDR